ncbi:acyl-CoA thioesterase [Exophiala xenobiotica]|uniref:Acyl-CoA thioesterase n=1 Tax=Lithohypha guttulata TaxID=1690604 RepID=A0ABR0JV69_9EURO|nr:acyl-CoA thioesterase [Lithohypha guttulata]KAK5311790.1 acyl-CoA thioesterase [Exophiala xenobiotica]
MSAAHIIPPIADPPGSRTHILGVINISDYHIMDVPLQLNEITFGMPAINDYSRTLTPNHYKIGTTLNHSIHFHVHDRFRADELTYIEAETSWAKDGRAMMSTKIFSKDDLLIATCVQEAFYVLKEGALDRKSGPML